MTLKKSFLIRPLEARDAAAVAAFLNSQSKEYMKFFYAFGSDETSIAKMLSEAEKDVYSGIFWQKELVGFFMLRGWDEGYEFPSLGIFVKEKYRGKRLLPLVIESAKVICKLSNVNKLIAKSHPDNAGLKNLLQLGFRQVGVEESTGNTIWHVDL